MEAISCKIFTFFISYHLFKCIIPYFSRKFKCFSRSRISITPKACISSMRSIVYHQHEVLYIIKPQAKCTLARDEIQGRNAPLMICTARRAAMQGAKRRNSEPASVYTKPTGTPKARQARFGEPLLRLG